MSDATKDKRQFVFIGADDIQVTYGGGDDPRQYFKVGDVLTLDKEEVHSWHTKLSFQEAPSKEFNSVCFEENPVSSYDLQREELLQEIGYTVSEDSQQPGLWLWTAYSSGSEISFGSRQEALDDAWRDIVQRTPKILATEEWDERTVERQIDYVRTAHCDVDHDDDATMAP